MGSNWPTFLKRLHRWLNTGQSFKLYAPHAAPAAPGRHKLAICDLIPNLGDAIMIFPLLDSLRRENPDIEISLFTQGAGKLIGNHPAVDHLYLMEGPRKSRLLKKVPLAHLIIWWWKQWRHLSFHTVVVLRGGVDPHRSHHLAWLLGGSRRFAYSTELEPERPEYQFKVAPLFTALVTEMRGVHEVSRGYEVLQLAGLVEKPFSIDHCVDSLKAIANSSLSKAYRQELRLHDHPYAVVALGASVPRRAWTSSGFAELALKEFIPRGWRIVLVGGPEIAEAVGEFKTAVNESVLDLTCKTTFEQLVAVCGGAKCFIGNDSGPAHIAGACGVPTLIITAFASGSLMTHHASPVRSRPLGPNVAVVQPAEQLNPCTTECVANEAHCIKQVTVEETIFALRALLVSASMSANAISSAGQVSV